MKKVILFSFLFFSFSIYAQNLEENILLNSIDKMRWGMEWNIDTIQKALDSKKENVRSFIVYALSEVRKKEAEPFLISFLTSSSPWERFQGIKGLFCLGLKDENLLNDLLNDNQKFVKLSAEAAIEKKLEPVISLLNEKDINLNLFGVELLPCFGKEGGKHLLNFLKDPRDEIRAKAAEGLRFYPDLLYQRALLETLIIETYFYVKNSISKSIVYNYNYPIIQEGIFNSKISKNIYDALKFFGKEKLFYDGLWEQINFIPKENLANLSEVLSFYVNDYQIEKAFNTLNKKTISNEIKAEILEFLAGNSIEKGLPYFENFLKSEDPILKGNAIWGLSSLKNKEHISEIEKGLNSENDYLRWCALWALGEILENSSLKYAEEFLNDKDIQVQLTARDIINKYKKEGSMSNHIIWLGHDTILIQFNGKNIYFDPYEIPQNSPPADYVFITHEHFDHLSLKDLKIIVKKGTKIIIPSQWTEKVKELNCEVIVVKISDKKKIDEFDLQVVPAYNPSKQFHPKSYGGVGFIVKIGQTVYYHSGDTDLIPEMKEFPEIDVAFLPVSGTYVMDAKEAAQATKVMKIKKAIPMHYGAIIGSEKDAEEFKKLASCPVEILKKQTSF